MSKALHRRLGPTSFLMVSFGGLILLAAGLLYLPPMQARPVSLLDCLFTATSAVCVTGLITVDTATAWTPLGKFVIMAGFQLGGLGIMTFSLAMLHLAGLRGSLTSYLAVSSTLGRHPSAELGRLTGRLILFTILAEAAGAAVLTLCFWSHFSWHRALALGVFHSVSAFCNAGFSLFTDSLQAYTFHPVVNLTVMALIIGGGLGFVVLGEVWGRLDQLLGRRNPFRRRWQREEEERQRPVRLSLHARMVLATSAFLVVGGAAALALVEWLGGPGKLWGWWPALFTSVTARTAGFNTTPMSTLTNASLLIIMGLMFVGASPGSTGGGIKTTALAAVFAVARARIKGLGGAVLFKRGIHERQVGEALTLILGSVAVLMVAVLLLEITEGVGGPDIHRGRVLANAFEAVSAFATVGLSMGVTGHLSPAGKLIIITLMFVGRLGPLTFIYAMISRSHAAATTPASERILLG